uniref:Uncharacterized protein n=1 Tax=uncultured gamma proteobacterium HF4000_06A21 TaxID=723581 RepID=E7C853_9GAMM|nr:hypothetical protein [uncultured gamma proteobacterium HF4000_06A21]
MREPLKKPANYTVELTAVNREIARNAVNVSLSSIKGAV